MKHRMSVEFGDETFFIDEIKKIIRRRWKTIERTTRYGWLSSICHGNSLTHEESSAISILVKKLGFDDSCKALDKIRNRSDDLHPRHILVFTISVLEEAYTVQMLRSQGKRSFLNKKPAKREFSSIFTIT